MGINQKTVTMGIKGIYKEIGPGQRISLCKLAVDTLEETGRPLRLAIDFSIWQFQVQAARGGSNPAIRTLFYRLIRLLSLAIQPLFVFDGPNKPAFKRNKRSYSTGRGDMVATAMAKRLIRLFGFTIHDAPGEAEAECALLEQQGVVDAVLSEDVDTIMFGCRKTLRNWSAEGTKGSKTPTHVSVYDAKAVAAGATIKLIRVLAPSLLVQNLVERYVSGERHNDLDLTQKEESALVRGVSSRRSHFSTDATPELRISFVPGEIAKLDLDSEPVEEVEAFGRSGIALNSDDEFDEEAEELGGEKQKSGSSKKPFDPSQPDLVWIPETIAKLGIPLTVEDWEGKQRLKGQKAAAKAPRQPRTKKTDMPVGALDRPKKQRLPSENPAGKELAAGKSQPERKLRPFKRAKSGAEDTTGPRSTQKTIKDFARVTRKDGSSQVAPKSRDSREQPIEILSDDDDDLPLPPPRQPSAASQSIFNWNGPALQGGSLDLDSDDDPFASPPPASRRTKSPIIPSASTVTVLPLAADNLARSDPPPAGENHHPQDSITGLALRQATINTEPITTIPSSISSNKLPNKPTTTLYIRRTSLSGDGYFIEREVLREQADAVLAEYNDNGAHSRSLGVGKHAETREKQIGDGWNGTNGTKGLARSRAFRFSDVEVLDLTGED
ncbi:hypothetical protein N0V88_000017 [Collariella sp. IMI 366227]|nr:hypothetical protein N0V88_000017 [Collariella sp. IMI 366227]